MISPLFLSMPMTLLKGAATTRNKDQRSPSAHHHEHKSRSIPTPRNVFEGSQSHAETPSSARTVLFLESVAPDGWKPRQRMVHLFERQNYSGALPMTQTLPHGSPFCDLPALLLDIRWYGFITRFACKKIIPGRQEQSPLCIILFDSALRAGPYIH